MARNTAAQGAAFERRIIANLAEYGYTSMRAAASKGVVDVFALGPLRFYEDGATPDAERLAIQAKLTDPQIGPKARMDVMDWALRAGAIPIVAHWAPDETTGLKRVHYRQLTGPGPKDWEPWAPGEEM